MCVPHIHVRRLCTHHTTGVPHIHVRVWCTPCDTPMRFKCAAKSIKHKFFAQKFFRVLWCCVCHMCAVSVCTHHHTRQTPASVCYDSMLHQSAQEYHGIGDGPHGGGAHVEPDVIVPSEPCANCSNVVPTVARDKQNCLTRPVRQSIQKPCSVQRCSFGYAHVEFGLTDRPLDRALRMPNCAASKFNE